MEEWFKDMSLVQGTDAWKAARSKRLGGSEIASVLRISPYKTRRDLWKEKVGLVTPPDISSMPHVQRGIKAEPIARGLLERKYRVKYTTPTLVHPEYKWAVASLDGICSEYTLEIKTMSRDKHEDVAKGEVPDYYECQVQWGLMISGLEKGLFASYRPEDGTLHEVWIKADETRQHWMLDQAKEFMGWVERNEEPPEDFVCTLK